MIVALYARVSTDGQDPDNQMIRLRQVSKDRGYMVYAEYIDVASGACARRPQLDRMLADAKAGRVQKIMAVKLDRLARSVINLTTIMRQFEEWGVQVEFLDQPIDTSTPSGRMTTTILAAVAEFERELICDRTRDGQARARSQGKAIGRPQRKLTDYQREKIRRILEEEPDISAYRLAQQFEGISRNTLIKLAKEEGLLRSDDLHHLVDRRFVFGRVCDAQVSEAVLLVVGYEFIEAVYPDYTASDQFVGLFDDVHRIFQQVRTHALVRMVRSAELTEKIALGDVVVRVDVHLFAQRLGDVLIIWDAKTSHR